MDKGEIVGNMVALVLAGIITLWAFLYIHPFVGAIIFILIISILRELYND